MQHIDIVYLVIGLSLHHPAAVAAVAILGGVVHDPVDAVGKQEFGIEVGYTLKMSYIDPEPPMGMKQYKDKTFTCKVKSRNFI